VGLKMGIRLVVKGPPATARRMAARHGVPARCFSENPFREKRKTRNDSYCDAPCSSLTKLQRWYAEPPPRNRLPIAKGRRIGGRFPDGSLVFFSTKGCANDALKGARRRRRRR